MTGSKGKDDAQDGQKGRRAEVRQLEPFHFSNNLPPDVRDKLKEIFANWRDEPKAEALVKDIIAQSPDTLGLRILAYRFYFYRRRPGEAAQWALSCLEWLADHLGLPRDWRQVTPAMADFEEWHAFTRLWLQSLTAYSYNLARLGRTEEALLALDKVAELDTPGKLGAAQLSQVFANPLTDAGMLFPKEG